MCLVLRFKEPDNITKICATCMRTNVPVAWDDIRWAYFCVDTTDCYNYLTIKYQTWKERR